MPAGIMRSCCLSAPLSSICSPPPFLDNFWTFRLIFTKAEIGWRLQWQSVVKTSRKIPCPGRKRNQLFPALTVPEGWPSRALHGLAQWLLASTQVAPKAPEGARSPACPAQQMGTQVLWKARREVAHRVHANLERGRGTGHTGSRRY